MQHRILRIALFIAIAARGVFAASPGEAEAQKCEEKIASVQREVLSKYDDSLQELMLTLQKAADLEGALAVRAERQRLAMEHTLAEENCVHDPKSLRTLQQQTAGKLRDLTAQLVQDALPKLVEYKKALTIAGKLDDAVAVRTAIEKLQNSYMPLVKADASSAVSSEALLTAYSADRARADKTYKGQRIIVRGVVGGYRQDPGDAKIWLVYLTGGTGGGWVQCAFAGDHRVREEKGTFGATVLAFTVKDGDTQRIQKGQTLDVRGVCEGLDEVVRLSKCDLPR